MSGKPYPLSTEEALGVIEKMQRAKGILYCQRNLSESLGHSTLNLDIALNGLDEAMKTVAKSAQGLR